MTQEHEELEVAVYDTGFAANKNLLISNGGMISGSSIIDVKVSFVGRPTERKSFSVGDSLKYDAGDQGIFEIRLITIGESTAKFLVSRIK
jgi:hypothetical protein